jgi:CPA2 family monovalent cation:H+ antiporter-2
MTASFNLAAYSDALVVLGTAGVVVPMVRRWGVNPVIGYLAAGAVLGPLGLGSFMDRWPILYWLTVVDADNVASIAELGVVFLLFLIGLELSFARLMTMRRLVFGLGGAQIVLTTVVLAAVMRRFGLDGGAALVVALCLSLSSTAIVVELLAAQNRLATTGGRAGFAILLAQDLAVVPVLMLISILGSGGGGSIWQSLSSALVQAIVALAGIVVLGRIGLRPLFRVVAAARSTELMIAAILFVVVGTGVIAVQAGMSMSLGAFVAGLLLAETEFRKAIEALAAPFKGLLLGMFFFSVGMEIDLREVAREPALLAGAIVGLLALKSLLLGTLGRLFLGRWMPAVEIAALLAPAGEFAFVGIGAALAAGIVEAGTAGFALTVGSMSMALIPGLGAAARRLEARFSAPDAIEAAEAVAPPAVGGHTIVVGHGRVGKVACAALRTHGLAHLAIDRDAVAVAHDRRAGLDVYYGDAASPLFLKACGLDQARAVLITIDDPTAIDAIVGQVRGLRSDIVICSRARDAAHARHLYAIGVTEAVPETIEASLQLSEAILIGLDVPMGRVIASIHAMRSDFKRSIAE